MYHYRRATIVANNDLRRGDLLFFHIHSRENADHGGVSGQWAVYRVAAHRENIRVSRLAEPFWQDHFWARGGLTEETICRPDKAFTPHPAVVHGCLMRR
ncbi:NlpC/P60 family protein [Escherichia coli]